MFYRIACGWVLPARFTRLRLRTPVANATTLPFYARYCWFRFATRAPLLHLHCLGLPGSRLRTFLHAFGCGYGSWFTLPDAFAFARVVLRGLCVVCCAYAHVCCGLHTVVPVPVPGSTSSGFLLPQLVRTRYAFGCLFTHGYVGCIAVTPVTCLPHRAHAHVCPAAYTHGCVGSLPWFTAFTVAGLPFTTLPPFTVAAPGSRVRATLLPRSGCRALPHRCVYIFVHRRVACRLVATVLPTDYPAVIHLAAVTHRLRLVRLLRFVTVILRGCYAFTAGCARLFTRLRTGCCVRRCRSGYTFCRVLCLVLVTVLPRFGYVAVWLLHTATRLVIYTSVTRLCGSPAALRVVPCYCGCTPAAVWFGCGYGSHWFTGYGLQFTVRLRFVLHIHTRLPVLRLLPHVWLLFPFDSHGYCTCVWLPVGLPVTRHTPAGCTFRTVVGYTLLPLHDAHRHRLPVSAGSPSACLVVPAVGLRFYGYARYTVRFTTGSTAPRLHVGCWLLPRCYTRLPYARLVARFVLARFARVTLVHGYATGWFTALRYARLHPVAHYATRCYTFCYIYQFHTFCSFRSTHLRLHRLVLPVAARTATLQLVPLVTLRLHVGYLPTFTHTRFLPFACPCHLVGYVRLRSFCGCGSLCPVTATRSATVVPHGSTTDRSSPVTALAVTYGYYALDYGSAVGLRLLPAHGLRGLHVRYVCHCRHAHTFAHCTFAAVLHGYTTRLLCHVCCARLPRLHCLLHAFGSARISPPAFTARHLPPRSRFAADYARLVLHLPQHHHAALYALQFGYGCYTARTWFAAYARYGSRIAVHRCARILRLHTCYGWLRGLLHGLCLVLLGWIIRFTHTHAHRAAVHTYAHCARGCCCLPAGCRSARVRLRVYAHVTFTHVYARTPYGLRTRLLLHLPLPLPRITGYGLRLRCILHTPHTHGLVCCVCHCCVHVPHLRCCRLPRCVYHARAPPRFAFTFTVRALPFGSPRCTHTVATVYRCYTTHTRWLFPFTPHTYTVVAVRSRYPVDYLPTTPTVTLRLRAAHGCLYTPVGLRLHTVYAFGYILGSRGLPLHYLVVAFCVTYGLYTYHVYTCSYTVPYYRSAGWFFFTFPFAGLRTALRYRCTFATVVTRLRGLLRLFYLVPWLPFGYHAVAVTLHGCLVCCGSRSRSYTTAFTPFVRLHGYHTWTVRVVTLPFAHTRFAVRTTIHVCTFGLPLLHCARST